MPLKRTPAPVSAFAAAPGFHFAGCVRVSSNSIGDVQPQSHHFAQSLPLGYSWCLPGQRKRVPYEYPQGRRVNAPAAYEPFAEVPWLHALPLGRTITPTTLSPTSRACRWRTCRAW